MLPVVYTTHLLLPVLPSMPCFVLSVVLLMPLQPLPLKILFSKNDFLIIALLFIMRKLTAHPYPFKNTMNSVCQIDHSFCTSQLLKEQLSRVSIKSRGSAYVSPLPFFATAAYAPQKSTQTSCLPQHVVTVVAGHGFRCAKCVNKLTSAVSCRGSEPGAILCLPQ